MLNNSIVSKIISGAFWTLLQTISLKLISFGSQIVLAWILLPEDFGKIALVYTITNISSLMQQFGLQDVLIKQGKSFNLWYPLSFGLTLFVSILSIIAALVFGFLGGYFYNDVIIFELVLIFAVSIPFQALSLLPDTKMKIELKFKKISVIKIIEMLLIQSGIVVFALNNFGVYSFVIPISIVAILRCVFLFFYTNLKLVYPSFKRWRYLTYNSLQGLLFAISSRLSMQVDVILLGLISSQLIIGIYFMGMSLSIQVIGFIGLALPSILFPALMSYSGKDLSKVIMPLQKIIIYTALLGVPFACWQATNVKPLISLFLSEKWLPSIAYVQIFSVGMIFRVFSTPWVVPLKLKGDFKIMSVVTFHSLLLLTIIISIFGYLYGPIGVAIGVSLFYFINTPYLIYKGFQGFNIDYKFMIFNILKIVVISVLSYGIIFVLTENISIFNDSHLLNLLFNTIVSSLLYLFFIFLFMKNFFLELFFKIKSL
jgi:O-antigen/teichoic acid export membrane protein